MKNSFLVSRFGLLRRRLHHALLAMTPQDIADLPVRQVNNEQLAAICRDPATVMVYAYPAMDLLPGEWAHDEKARYVVAFSMPVATTASVE